MFGCLSIAVAATEKQTQAAKFSFLSSEDLDVLIVVGPDTNTGCYWETNVKKVNLSNPLMLSLSWSKNSRLQILSRKHIGWEIPSKLKRFRPSYHGKFGISNNIFTAVQEIRHLEGCFRKSRCILNQETWILKLYWTYKCQMSESDRNE